MSTTSRADALKRQLADLQSLAKAEDAAESAKRAYRKAKNDKNKAAHRKAATALAEARAAVRANGGPAVTPSTVAASTKES